MKTFIKTMVVICALTFLGSLLVPWDQGPIVKRILVSATPLILSLVFIIQYRNQRQLDENERKLAKLLPLLPKRSDER